MRRLLLLLFAVTSGMSANAQELKFSSPWNTWALCTFPEKYYSSVENEYESPQIYHVVFDSWTIDDKDYCRARNTLYPVGTKFDYFREEDGKVYVYVENDKAEYLFYNFAALEGEEFDIYVNQDNRQCHCLVTKVDSVVIDNTKLKRVTFNVKGDTFAEKEEVWIEVLGRLGNPLCNVSLNDSDIPEAHLLCITDHANVLYISQPINEKHFKGQRLADSRYIEFDPEGYKPMIVKADAHFEKDTLCFKGVVRTILSGNDYVYCRDDEERNIEISFANYGLQWESGALYEVSFRIPGYSDGVYKITDADGTYEVICGNVADGIKPVVQEHHTELYDLQGIRQGNGARGIVVKNGRKTVVQPR